MKWKLKCLLILLISVPAFTGFSLNTLPGQPIPGIQWGWVIYFLIVNITIRLMLKNVVYGNIMAITTLVTIPVVFGGASVAKIFQLLTGPAPMAYAPYSAHYVGLCLNMLTVVPLALTMAASIPFRLLEQNALTKSHGISPLGKIALMALRVFNHIAFFIAPNIIEVMREELLHTGKHLKKLNDKHHHTGMSDKILGALKSIRQILSYFIHLSVEGICSAIQNIPLWALELSRLPNQKEKEFSG